MNALKLWENPLVTRGVRSRLRLSAMLSWGLVTVVSSLFLYILVYGNAIKNANTSPQEAAREAILPLLIMQGVILMVLGTGAVAGGMARERTYRLLDYQRLTPMSPASKIIGMLVGLPIREYFMFALSLPVVFYAANKGGLSLSVLLQFYMVFLSSAVIYHMTGLAAGMVVNKPWQAGTVSQGLVVVLYLVLPQVSHFGFTFFEFLTARPVFYGLVNQHLLPDGWSGIMQGAMLDAQHERYRTVPFFGMRLSPVFFSIAVQAYTIVSLYVIVYRKWQSEARLPFSKGYAVLFFAAAQLFLVGSVQPLLRNDRLFEQLAASYQMVDQVKDPTHVIVFAIFLINLCVSGCAAMLTVFLCTPNWYQSLAGLRRSVRKGVNRLALTDDAASSMPVAVACLLMSALSFLVIYQTASSAGRVNVVNPVFELLLPMVFFAVVLLTIQQVLEQFSEKIFVMALFVFWIVPILGAIIIATVADQPIGGLYFAIPFPFIALYLSSATLMSGPGLSMDRDVLPLPAVEHAMPVILISLVFYGAAAALLLFRARRRWRRMRVASGATQESPAKQDSVRPSAEHGRAGQPVPVYAQQSDPPTPS